MEWRICVVSNEEATLSIDNAKFSMAQAATTAERYVGGKAVHAEFERHKNWSTFDIEVVKDKIVMKVIVDPTSGQVISSAEDKDNVNYKQDKADWVVKTTDKPEFHVWPPNQLEC